MTNERPYLPYIMYYGGEFINYAMNEFCQLQAITFTRSRAYRKNDQAHVEEKNGSIIRKIVGYDRYEGVEAYNALGQLYAVLRLYVNFFQPSLKLKSKERIGAKVIKQYDIAKTPYQRLCSCATIPDEVKSQLKAQYQSLDPIHLLKELERLQDQFWKFAWKTGDFKPASVGKIQSSENISIPSQPNISTIAPYIAPLPPQMRDYRQTHKPRKPLALRTWRTRKDPFEQVWNELALQLRLTPQATAKSLLDKLIKIDPNSFHINQLRTLQRRVAQWRRKQIKMHQTLKPPMTSAQFGAINTYISLVAQAING